MKFTLDWLKDHLETSATADAISEALTTIGLEVESVEDPARDGDKPPRSRFFRLELAPAFGIELMIQYSRFCLKQDLHEKD